MSDLTRTGRINEFWGSEKAFDLLQSPENPIYDYYLIQTLPDFLVQKTGAFETFNALFDEQRERGRWLDPVRILHFMTYVEMANKLESGVYAEFGVGAGVSAGYTYSLMNEQNDLYLFDTFSGFTEADVNIENDMFATDISSDLLDGYTPQTIIDQISGGDRKRDIEITAVPGSVPESFEPYRNLKFRFVSVDMDLYQPTAGLLENIWDFVVPGGIMLFHDYGCKLFPGISKAVDEFFNPRGITAVPLPDWTVSAIVIKPLS